MTDHPFRDNKPGLSARVKDAPLHAPCPHCYSDCLALAKLPRANRAQFLCGCGHGFSRGVDKARKHTTWLLTRGRIGVHVAIGKEGAE